VIEKASGCVARCSLDGETTHRSLELPTWMLGRVACAPMRIEAHPWVDIAALDALTTLLADVSVAGAVSSNVPFATAQVVSCDANRGDHDAMPTQGAPRPSIQDGTVRSVCGTQRRDGADAETERTSGGGSPGANTLDGAVAPRLRARRSRAKGAAR